MLKHFCYFRRRLVTFEHFRKFEKRGKSNAASTPIGSSTAPRIAANELRYLFFVIEDLTEGEEVLFPMLRAYSRMALPNVRAKSRSTFT